MMITGSLAETVGAIEEAVATAAPAAAGRATGGFSIFKIVLIALGAYQIVTGLLTVVTKKFYGMQGKEYAKYTEESVRANMTLIGLSSIFLGVMLIVVELTMMHTLPMAAGIVVGVLAAGIAIALSVVASKRMQKKP